MNQCAAPCGGAGIYAVTRVHPVIDPVSPHQRRKREYKGAEKSATFFVVALPLDKCGECLLGVAERGGVDGCIGSVTLRVLALAPTGNPPSASAEMRRDRRPRPDGFGFVAFSQSSSS
jgi:hypothetical protein